MISGCRPSTFLGAAMVCFTLSLPGFAIEGGGIDWNKERQFWAFQPPVRQPLPLVRHRSWPRQPLDYFVLAKLEANQLAASPAASKRVLIRRVTLDLTGLPPRPEEIERFVADQRSDAYARVVEGLIQSRAFGERLASLWLPLARYAEDQAHQVGNDTKFFYPNAFKYREWVIASFNADLPYDLFIKYQLAADKFENAGPANLPALGFLGLGPKYYNRNRLEVMADEWEDRVDTVTRAMLGLTVACARCHDHKFEPITQADYYALAGVFASTKMVNKAADGTEESKDASAEKMSGSTLHMVEDGEAKDLNIFLRGNPERQGELAHRRFIRVLCEGEPKPFQDGSGRRELAEAIASPENPLTARVLVNRVWAAFFGQGLVATPSNFGHSGQRPSHPELLDDLAARFMENGWRIKPLIREIVLSSTYRQSSDSVVGPRKLHPAVAGKPVWNRSDSSGAPEIVDAENRLFWRMNRKRLSVEQWRDSVLFAANELSDQGGKSLELDDPANFRRTVYSRVSRLKLNDTLMQFDYPDANVHAERRAVTTTPMQKLFMMNNPFVLERAKAFAAALAALASNEQRIQRAYVVLFGREPDKSELRAGLKFLSAPEEGEYSRLARYAQILFASNEFMYVD